MDRNTLIGLILMGVLLFGFTFFQNKQYQKQAEFQAQLDSIAAVERFRADSIAAAEAALRDTVLADTLAAAPVPVSVYKDSLLGQAHDAEGEEMLIWESRSMPGRTSTPPISTLRLPKRPILPSRCVFLSPGAATSSRGIPSPKAHIL